MKPWVHTDPYTNVTVQGVAPTPLDTEPHIAASDADSIYSLDPDLLRHLLEFHAADLEYRYVDSIFRFFNAKMIEQDFRDGPRSGLYNSWSNSTIAVRINTDTKYRPSYAKLMALDPAPPQPFIDYWVAQDKIVTLSGAALAAVPEWEPPARRDHGQGWFDVSRKAADDLPRLRNRRSSAHGKLVTRIPRAAWPSSYTFAEGITLTTEITPRVMIQKNWVKLADQNPVVWDAIAEPHTVLTVVADNGPREGEDFPFEGD